MSILVLITTITITTGNICLGHEVTKCKYNKQIHQTAMFRSYNAIAF